MRVLFVASLLVAGALGAGACSDDGALPAECAESPGELFERRIAPLLAEDQPKGCTQCHLAGVDLASFVRDDACESMACLREDGLVDLRSPENSVVLSWIGRAEPDSDLITEEVIEAERAAFLEWIRHEAACGACADAKCGKLDKAQLCKVSHDPTSEPAEVDPGGCDDMALEELFLNTVFAARGRCYPCHFDDLERPVPGARAWIEQRGSCEAASATTLRRILDGGYVDVEQPDQSLLLRKPLLPEDGGLPHGGSAKFRKDGDAGYDAFLYWLTRYAECRKP